MSSAGVDVYSWIDSVGGSVVPDDSMRAPSRTEFAAYAANPTQAISATEMFGNTHDIVQVTGAF